MKLQKTAGSWAKKTNIDSDLYSSMTAEVKVKLIGMRDVRIYGSTSRNVSTTSNLTNTKLGSVLANVPLAFPPSKKNKKNQKQRSHTSQFNPNQSQPVKA